MLRRKSYSAAELFKAPHLLRRGVVRLPLPVPLNDAILGGDPDHHRLLDIWLVLIGLQGGEDVGRGMHAAE